MDFWSFRKFERSRRLISSIFFSLKIWINVDEVAEFKTKKDQQIFVKDIPKEAIKKMKGIFDLFDDEKKGCTNITIKI